jgi:acetolactate synthase regulatory subunit
MFSLVTSICALSLAQQPDLENIVQKYMNFGENPNYPTDYSCATWSHLFEENGVRQTPGLPPASGYTQINHTCTEDREMFKTFIGRTSSTPINVTSWNEEVRVAFVWGIKGTKEKGGENVEVPAITGLFMGETGKIQTAWDFLDPTKLVPHELTAGADPKPLTEIVESYVSFGGDDCEVWADLWTTDGTRNTPGIPPTSSHSSLEKVCTAVRKEGFTSYEATVTTSQASTSWNMERRVAFEWTITGIVKATGKHVDVRAITMLFLDNEGKIEVAWDFLDPKGLPTL